MAKLEKGVNDLATVNPELAAQWHPTKNGDLKPADVTAGSKKKVWWRCDNGHEWEASINHRAKGTGCPYCAGKKVCEDNNLEKVFPDVAAEWHPTKNGDLNPADVASGSGKKVWWLCNKCGNEWEASISHRVNGTGCPCCAGQETVQNINDLSTTHPYIAEEWHPVKNGNLNPTDVKSGSGKKVWWRCRQGHEWKATVNNRANKAKGCPYCSGRLPVIAETDLNTINYNLAKEWHPTLNGNLKPTDVKSNSGKKVWWLCPDCRHEWQAVISSRNSGVGCPICAKHKSSSFPEQATYYYVKKHFPSAILEDRENLSGKELDIYIPSLKTGIEYDGGFFHQDVEKDIEKNKLAFKKGIKLIRIREHRCPILEDNYAEYTVRKNDSIQDLEETIETILLKLKINPYDIDVDVDRDYSDILHQTISYKKMKSLQSTHPRIAQEWHSTKNGDLTPELITHTSNKKAWWQCERGHEWKSTIRTRCQCDSKCPYCAGAYVITGETDLQTTHPEIAAQWHPTKNGILKPTDVKAGSSKKVWWQCEHNHEWETTVNARKRGSDCPICFLSKIKRVPIKNKGVG